MNTKAKERKALANIDTALAICGDVMGLLHELIDANTLTFSVSTNPIELLVKILVRSGKWPRDEVIRWMSYFVTATVPALEIAIKGIILTNLKSMVACSVDPRIPDYLRYDSVETQEQEDGTFNNGIVVSIEAIDILDKLRISPLSEEGKYKYFGLEGVNDIGKLARAVDFDAFLWFVMHCGKFPNSGDFDATFKDDGTNYSLHPLDDTSAADASVITPCSVTYQNGSDTVNKLVVGSTYTSSKVGGNKVVSLCADMAYTSDGDGLNPYEATLLPLSLDLASVNWYADPTQYIRNLGGNLNKDKRDYTKEIALCNLQYIGQSTNSSKYVGLVDNKFKFTILPKPYMSGLRRVLIGNDCKYNKNGNYTIAKNYGYKVKINNKNIESWDGDALVANNPYYPYIIPSYKGFTVYEFNYDYTMSMRLFDPKVIAATLLDRLINLHLGLGLTFNAYRNEEEFRIADIISKILKSDDATYNDDCFFTFDNSKYEAMMERTAELRAKGYEFGTSGNTAFKSIAELLDSYDTATTLHSREEAISRAFTEAAVLVSQGSTDENSYGVECSFVMNLVESLVQVLVEAVLTPKVLLLFEVNNQLMGQTWHKLSFEELLMQMRGIIVTIVRQVKDLVAQELLKLVIKLLDPIVATVKNLILKEILDEYVAILRDIINNCPFIWFSLGQKLVDTELDTVDYADIDTTVDKRGDVPKNANC